jgi:transcriptional regulator with XRE-family HTH domain
VHVTTDGAKLKAMREGPARTFARSSGISPATLRKAERGGPVELATARKIARALGTDPRTFARAISRRPS